MEDVSIKAVAIVRYPGQEPLAFSSTQSQLNLKKITTNEQGFIYAPYNIDDGVFFLKPEKNYGRLVQFIEWCEEETNITNDVATSREDYFSSAKNLLSELHSGQLKKVILSRIIVHSPEYESGVLNFFQKLCETYPTACVHLFANPKTGIWVGASPELLLNIENSVLQTVALAGTKNKMSTTQLEIKWERKEIEEQFIVSEFIDKLLKNQSGIEQISQSMVETVKAANVYHLISRFSAKVNSQFDWTDLIEKLHPTPAVCGLPLVAAKKAIAKNESHSREFYTGFFGTCTSNTVKLHVNLRCLKWYKNQVQVYVGGGLTKHSIIEDEWEETNDKSLTLLNVLLKP